VMVAVTLTAVGIDLSHLEVGRSCPTADHVV